MTPAEISARREDWRLLQGVFDAVVLSEGRSYPVKARRHGFSRKSMELFGSVLIDRPSGYFRLWGFPPEVVLNVEAMLAVGNVRWRVVGVIERVVEGETIGHSVMVTRIGGTNANNR